MLRAAAIAQSAHGVAPILTGAEADILAVAAAHSLDVGNLEICDPAKDSRIGELIEVAASGPRKLSPAIAARMLRKPLMYSACLVRAQRAQAMVAGASVPTAKVLEAGLIMIGAQQGIGTPSSYFAMHLPANGNAQRRTVLFADCAVNVNPTAEQLADIAISTARNARHILESQPRVAMLSFSSRGSARHELVSKVVEATAIVAERDPNLLIDGELQFDAAFDPRVAELKLGGQGEQAVAGCANVFIFPDLNSGNIGYKIAQYLAGAKAIGPVLQGFAHPVSDLSRGATVDDIVETTKLLLAASGP